MIRRPEDFARPNAPSRRRRAMAVAPLVTALFVSLPVAAEELSAELVAAAVADRTYQGSMTADAFAEYYAADGTIRGDGYTGTWRAQPDTLCFAYGGADEQCWGVLINGPAMTLLKDGKVDGSGMLVDGNPLGL